MPVNRALEVNRIYMERFWKLYIWLLVFIYTMAFVGSLMSTVFVETSQTLPNHVFWVLYTFVSFISLAGIYGYYSKKAILNKTLWRLVFAFLVASLLHTLYVYSHIQSELPHITTSKLVYMALMQLIFIPQYYAIYKYGWGSGTLWEGAISDNL